MRRAAAAVIAGGYAFGGLGTGTGHAPVIVSSHQMALVHSASGVPPAAKPTGSQAGQPGQAGQAGQPVGSPAGPTGTRTVEFRGYQIAVPAGWPVYRLDQHPDQCVRYDVHAVYLGTPGASQQCPPDLVGRTETVSIGDPASSSASSSAQIPAIVVQQATAQGATAQGATAQGPTAHGPTAQRTTERGSVPSAPPRRALQDAQEQEFAVTMPASAPAITATYGSDPALVRQVLASVRQVVRQAAARPGPAASLRRPITLAGAPASQQPPNPFSPSAPTAASSPAVPPSAPGGTAATGPTATGPTATGPATTGPAAGPTPVPTGTPSVPGQNSTANVDAVPGFDTCTAPSVKAMRAWRKRFKATAIYIGGEEMACDYGNLSPSWVQKTESMHWSLLPTYVGPQAPCSSFSGRIHPRHAAAEGRSAANDAISNASALGLSHGTPIYFDMEAYAHTNNGCATAVLSFLDGWTRQLESRGYISGVYSSADAAIINLQSATTVGGHRLAEPQAIWFALWDNSHNLNGSPYLKGQLWSCAERSKQFSGGHWMKVGGISLDIDSDLVSGPVARA